MTERIFNLFLEIKNHMIYELGAAYHDIEGGDKAKLAFLQKAVRLDLPRAKRYPMPDRYQILDPVTSHRTSAMNYDAFALMAQRDKHLEVFEEIFQELKGSAHPLVCITPIVDGTPQIHVLNTSKGTNDHG